MLDECLNVRASKENHLNPLIFASLEKYSCEAFFAWAIACGNRRGFFKRVLKVWPYDGTKFITNFLDSECLCAFDIRSLEETDSVIMDGVDLQERIGGALFVAGVDRLAIISSSEGFPLERDLTIVSSIPVVVPRPRASVAAVLRGDVDFSGEIDLLDIMPFIRVLQFGAFQSEADTNCDTVVDFADILPFIAIL